MIMFDEIFEQNYGINIFYHLLCINDGINRFLKTYNKICRTGLINKTNKIYVNIVGCNKKICAAKLSKLNKLIISFGEIDTNESSTLNLLRNFCIEHPIGHSLYLHSKGVVRQNDPKILVKEGIQDWIDCMEYFLIEKHTKCLDILNEQYNSCGINYEFNTLNQKNVSGHHYSGNFWWASNQYLATTQYCKDEYMYCEIGFLFSGNNPKPYELYHAPFPWWQWTYRRHKREEYELS